MTNFLLSDTLKLFNMIEGIFQTKKVITSILNGMPHSPHNSLMCYYR